MNTRPFFLFLLAAVLLALFGAARADEAPPRAGEGNRDSTGPSISADGRYVVFASEAFDLIPDDLNRRIDVYLYDRAGGETTLLSRGSGLEVERERSSEPVISADGRFVAYSTWDKNLLPEGTHYSGIMVLTRDTGELYMASRSTAGELPIGWATQPSISADGRYITFLSNASNLIDGLDGNCSPFDWYCEDVYLHDRTTGQTIVVSRHEDGWLADETSSHPAVSADGRVVVFDSLATNLLTGQPGAPDIPAGTSQVYAYDVADAQLSLVSRTDAGAAADGQSYAPAVSPDGRLVAFASMAANLAPAAPAASNVYLHDRDTGQTTLLTCGGGGANANGDSWAPAFSPDGRYLAFSSLADNLVPGDTNGQRDVFICDLETATLALVSRAGNGATGNGDSDNPTLADGGHFVAFETRATNMGGGVGGQALDVALRDQQTGETRVITARPLSWQGNSESRFPAISADGRFIAFGSYATNLVPGDDNGRWDIFYYDTLTGETTLIGRDGPEAGESRYPLISSDGQTVVFQSYIPSGSTGIEQIFVHDRRTGVTELVSRAADGSPANANADMPALSDDGRTIVFSSMADNLAPNDRIMDRRIFLFDRQTDALRAISVADMGLDTAMLTPTKMAISGDGRAIAFTAHIDSDKDVETHVLIYDLTTGEATRVTPESPRDYAIWPKVGNFSSDGRYLTYDANMVVPDDNDSNERSDIYVFDRQTGETRLISRSPAGEVGNSGSWEPTLSADGRFVAFVSYADNLAPVDNSRFAFHVYLHDRQTGATKAVMPSLRFVSSTNEIAISADGHWIAATSDVPLVAGDMNGLADVFVYNSLTEQFKLISGLIPGPYDVYTVLALR